MGTTLLIEENLVGEMEAYQTLQEVQDEKSALLREMETKLVATPGRGTAEMEVLYTLAGKMNELSVKWQYAFINWTRIVNNNLNVREHARQEKERAKEEKRKEKEQLYSNSERQPDEVFVGYMEVNAFQFSDHRTKRMGNIASRNDNKVFYPVFISQREAREKKILID